MNTYIVTVSNIGTVYDGKSWNDAKAVYYKYKDLSMNGSGRAANESVTLLSARAIKWEYIPVRPY